MKLPHHGRYDYAPIHRRPDYSWPGGKRLAVYIGLNIEHFAYAAGLGTVWLFSRLGEPLYRVRSCAGLATTNVAYGGPERKHLYITESETGTILVARLPVAGRPMYSHS